MKTYTSFSTRVVEDIKQSLLKVRHEATYNNIIGFELVKVYALVEESFKNGNM